MNKIKGTSWQSQQGDGEFSLQFETDNKAKYKFVEKAAQMAVDGKHDLRLLEKKHGSWSRGTGTGGSVYAHCSACGRRMNEYCYGYAHCPMCGAPMDGERAE